MTRSTALQLFARASRFGCGAGDANTNEVNAAQMGKRRENMLSTILEQDNGAKGTDTRC